MKHLNLDFKLFYIKQENKLNKIENKNEKQSKSQMK